jgi:hypothetical protein
MKMRMTMIAFGLFAGLLARGQSSNVNELPPLTELGKGKFMGEMGGLYPNGSNVMPEAFYNDAVEMASSIQPLNAKGNPDPNGKVGMISIGASTVAMFGKAVEEKIYGVKGIRNDLVFVNGGVGGQDLNKIADQSGRYWTEVDKRVKAAGLTNEQVQVMWFQVDDLRNTISSFPDRPNMLVESFTWHIQQMKKRYPNLKLLYLTGRHTTEYMPSDAKPKHKEPRAYLNGWACKWIIEKQIDGDPGLSYQGTSAKAPLLLWGPYFWTQGEKTRSDGYSFTPDLTVNDGVHPNAAGEVRVANDLLDFWKSDPVSAIWLTGAPAVAVNEVAEEEYLELMVRNKLLMSMDADELEGHLLLLVLKGSEVVSSEVYKPEAQTIRLDELEEGLHTLLMVDKGDYLERRDFTIDAYGQLVVESDEDKEETSEENSSKSQAWIVNGKDKMHKMRRLLGENEKVTAVIYDLNGKELHKIEDVLYTYTDLNAMLDRGEYVLKFFRANGSQIAVEKGIPEVVRIK